MTGLARWFAAFADRLHRALPAALALVVAILAGGTGSAPAQGRAGTRLESWGRLWVLPSGDATVHTPANKLRDIAQ
jgi:hypothetical protein